MRTIPHPPKCVFHLDFAHCFAGMAFDFLKELSLCWDYFPQGGLEVWLAEGAPDGGLVEGSY